MADAEIGVRGVAAKPLVHQLSRLRNREVDCEIAPRTLQQPRLETWAAGGPGLGEHHASLRLGKGRYGGRGEKGKVVAPFSEAHLTLERRVI